MGDPSASWGRACPHIIPSGLGFLLLASLEGAPGSLALRTTGHGTERGDPPGPARRGRRRRTRRTVRDPGPALRGLDVHPAEGEGGPTGERLRGPPGRSPATAARSLSPPWPLPSPPAPPAPSATPKPQGQDAQPPAFPPSFPLGDVPQNTQPSGGGGSLVGPLGTHLKALAQPGWGPLGQPKPRLAGGRAFRG